MKAFINMDEVIVKIFTAIIRPTLEHNAVLWSPHFKKDIEKLERIQKAALRWVPTPRNMKNEDRQKIGLITFDKRRKRGDIINMYRKSNVK